MEKIIYRKTLDVHKNGIQFTLQGFETADNMSRRLEISLMASGDAIDFPLEDVVAQVYVTTPNATEPSIEHCVIRDNVIIYDMTPIVKEGITEMQIKIIGMRVGGAKAVLASPRFAVEVTKSNIDDESAMQSTSFTALENAVAKANAIYNARLLRIEVDDNCVFKAYYADGTVYETDAIQKQILQVTTDMDLTALVRDGLTNFTADEVASELDERYSKLFSTAKYTANLLFDCPEAMFVRWDSETENTPFKAGLTDIQEGFALVCGKKDKNHTITAWTNGGAGSCCFVYSKTEENIGGWNSLFESLAGEGLARKDLSNVDDEVFSEKMERAENFGTIKFQDDLYDCVLGNPYFYLSSTVSVSECKGVFLSEDCIGYISYTTQAFYSRETGELLYKFTVDMTGNGDKITVFEEHPKDICIVRCSDRVHDKCYQHIFNYKTGKHACLREFDDGGDDVFTHFGGQKGDSLYFYHPVNVFSFRSDAVKVTELNASTLEIISTSRQINLPKPNNSLICYDDEIAYCYSEACFYIPWVNYTSEIFYLYKVDLSAGDCETMTIIDVTEEGLKLNSQVLFMDRDKSELYFKYRTSLDGNVVDDKFARYNYEKKSLTVLCNNLVEKNVNRYIGNTSNNAVVLEYEDYYLREINLNTGELLKISPEKHRYYINSAAYNKYYRDVYGKYIFSYAYSVNNVVDTICLAEISNFERFKLSYKKLGSESKGSQENLLIQRFGNEYIMFSDPYYTIYNGKDLPSARDIITLIRK